MIEHLTDEQARLFDYLQSHQFASVLGCAGWGKTTLVLAFAAHLHREGLWVLFLCRNPYLAENITRRFQGTQVAVYAFTDFIKFRLQSAQPLDVFVPCAPAGWQTPWMQYETPTQSELNRALDILYLEHPRYDAVIIDEGQDFETGWLQVAETYLKDVERARFAIFFDDNLLISLYSAQRLYADIQAPISLSRNCRSVGEIGSLVRKLHPGSSSPGLLSEDSGTVQEWNYSSESELLDRLGQALLAAEEFYPKLEDVVVLSSESVPSRQE